MPLHLLGTGESRRDADGQPHPSFLRKPESRAKSFGGSPGPPLCGATKEKRPRAPSASPAPRPCRGRHHAPGRRPSDNLRRPLFVARGQALRICRSTASKICPWDGRLGVAQGQWRRSFLDASRRKLPPVNGIARWPSPLKARYCSSDRASGYPLSGRRRLGWQWYES